MRQVSDPESVSRSVRSYRLKPFLAGTQRKSFDSRKDFRMMSCNSDILSESRLLTPKAPLKSRDTSAGHPDYA